MSEQTQLLTAFSQNHEGRRLVIVGLTDAMIEEIKTKGGILQDADRNGQNTDVAILYAPEIVQLVAKLKKAVSKVEIKFI